MANYYDIWAWYGQGLIAQSGGNDLTDGLNGTVFTAGPDFDYELYGNLQMKDANEDGFLQDTDVDDASSYAGDRIVTPDGTERMLNEIAVYNDSKITYLDGNSNEQTWVMNLTVWQIANGDTVLRINNGLNSTWPSDFNPANIKSITLGVWNEVEYTQVSPSYHQDRPPVCFAAGTLIKTEQGETPVEHLAVGMHVETLDAGYQKVLWIGSQRLSQAQLQVNPELLPVRIRAGALGCGQPERDLVVSPQHRILVRSTIAERMFGVSEVLVAAKHLTKINGIEVVQGLQEVVYWHFLCGEHQVVFSNGAATESLYTGPEALKSVSLGALVEIFEIFPELKTDPIAASAPARQLVPGRRARRLAERIAKNSQQVALPRVHQEAAAIGSALN